MLMNLLATTMLAAAQFFRVGNSFYDIRLRLMVRDIRLRLMVRGHFCIPSKMQEQRAQVCGRTGFVHASPAQRAATQSCGDG